MYVCIYLPSIVIDFSGELSKTMWKLCLSAKIPHQEIRWNCDILPCGHQRCLAGSLKGLCKVVYMRNVICKKILLQKLNRSIYLADCFFQRLVIIFMWKDFDIEDFNFSAKISRSYKAQVMFLHFLKHLSHNHSNLQNNTAILFLRKSSK